MWAGAGVAAVTAAIVLSSPPKPSPPETTLTAPAQVDASRGFSSFTPIESPSIVRNPVDPEKAPPATSDPSELIDPNEGVFDVRVPQSPAAESTVGIAIQPESDVPAGAPPVAVPVPVSEALAPNVENSAIQSPQFETTFEQSGAPLAEAMPVFGAAAAPLSLAQVLPPGDAPAPDQIAPSFDLVRVSPDGSAVIAGRAAPGANVQVFSGKVPIAEATASARGEFVLFLDSPTDQTPNANVPATPEGATLVVSQDDIVILPTLSDEPDAAPIVVRRTPDAMQVVQPSSLAVPNNVSLDLVSYADSGAVQLAGRGQPGNTARIYTNDVLTGEAIIAAGGNWQLEVMDIAEGRYVLRVDEIDPSGSVLSRTESPFQREFPEADLPAHFSQGAKIIVQPGNTLWLMATEAYGAGGAYTQIYSANRDAIRDPDLIYPGQIFSIPRSEE